VQNITGIIGLLIMAVQMVNMCHSTSYGSFDYLFDQCHLMSLRCWFRHSFHVAWTIAPHCSTALQLWKNYTYVEN